MTIFGFIVGRWLGVNGERESGSVRGSSVKGGLFTTASASHISVIRDSSSNFFIQYLSSSIQFSRASLNGALTKHKNRDIKTLKLDN